jgi:Fe-S-cluster-containing dehydrogenase component
VSKPGFPLSRRDVLTVLGLGGLTAVAGKWITDSQLFPVQTELEVDEPERAGTHHWVMVNSMETCTGCGQCTSACQATKNTPDAIVWNVITHEFTSKGREYHIARPCLHCENPPCTDVCPVEATYRRDDGLVVMDYSRCIGCRYCMVACPYGARSFNWEDPSELPRTQSPEWGDPEVEMRPRGVVEKCTFCIERIDRAIAEARFFGDLNDPDSQVSRLIRENSTMRLREELGTAPRVYYILPEGGL